MAKYEFIAFFLFVLFPAFLLAFGSELNKIPHLAEGFILACTGLILLKLIQQLIKEVRRLF